MGSIDGVTSAITSVNWGSFFVNLLLGSGIFIIIAGFATWGYINYRDKKIFITPVSLIQIRGNGSFKRRNDLVGGLIKQRNGVTDFVIKVPKQFKKKNLGYVPDFSLANSDDGIVFVTSGDNMVWQQCKESLITEKEINVQVKNKQGEVRNAKVLTNLIIEPIPTDVKHITINNINAAESVLEGNKLKVTALAIGAFLLMVIVQIIFLFVTAK